MYVLSINSFVANWLLLCLISPLYSGAEKPQWIRYEVNDPMRYQFRPIQSDEVPGEKQQQFNISKYEHKELYYDHAVPQRVENRELLKEKSNIQISQLDQRDKETRKKDEEMMKKMNLLNRILSEESDENDVELKNIIEDRMIAESTISEEAKRVARQVRRQRPGFFWTLAKIVFETFNDTRSAIQQINNIIEENFEPDTTTQLPNRSNLLTMPDAKPTTPSEDQTNMFSNLADVNVTTTATTTTARTTTTPKPFKFTRNGVQSLIMRNLRGLVRLFNIEWQDALNQSDVSVKEFQKNLGNQVGGFLQDNPDAF
ncbi:PREDICTED: uncharacterized protein LOC106745090 [Dinoponera quadriceps]|uniref:Uncharacterized protein LOC106745090 n=1 Tax=Dinoponera quadriceps TaxID=609295 RepID=A0A6P3XD92_DINQU|nr:PREDICTED: uncharacterized protein LOC106745090 [Dinoponera quadriceps]XP_014475854.1 PREDICTED: uncharacterized protein LOC106745090 [Dinoponera quadriceps]